MMRSETYAVRASMNCKPTLHEGRAACVGCVHLEVRAAQREAVEAAFVRAKLIAQDMSGVAAVAALNLELGKMLRELEA